MEQLRIQNLENAPNNHADRMKQKQILLFYYHQARTAINSLTGEQMTYVKVMERQLSQNMEYEHNQFKRQ